MIQRLSWMPATLSPPTLNPNLCRKIRASILLAGPLISRVKEIVMPPPGGDVIGRRRLDSHILAFSQLGVDTHYSNNLFHFKVDQLHGADILMDEASVTGTENAIMACILAKGEDNITEFSQRTTYSGIVSISQNIRCKN